MKNNLRIPCLTALSFFFALGMTFFTFFDWGWFSGQTGWIARWAVPIGTQNGPLSMLSDILWLLSPFFCIFAIVLSTLGRKGYTEKISYLLFSLPLSLYSLLKFSLSLAEKKESPLSLNLLYFVLIILGLFTLICAFKAEGTQITAHLSLFHAVMEAVLVLVSFLLKERLSPFYFSQLLPVGFRFTYFLISTFCYYLFHSLSLACFLYSKKQKEPDPQNEKKAS